MKRLIKKLFEISLFQRVRGIRDHQSLVIGSIGMLILSGSLAFSTLGYVKNEGDTEPVAAPEILVDVNPSPSAGSVGSATPVQSSGVTTAAVLTLKRQGFQPKAITRSPNESFVLMVNNRTGLDAITLNLDKETGVRLNSATVHLSNPDWFKLLTLEKGVYILKEANHPEWNCTITVK